MLLGYSIFLARYAVSIIWEGERVSGEVVDVLRDKSADGYVPVVAYVAKSGQRYTFSPPRAVTKSAFAAGDRVSVYYDRNDEARAALSDFYAFWLEPLTTAALSGLLLLVAGVLAPPPSPRNRSAKAALVPSDGRGLIQYHPLNAIALKLYLAHATAPSGTAKVQITESAAALPQGRYPLVLCEFLAGIPMIAAADDPLTFVKERMPHLKQVRAFGPESARGLMFLFEETAFIVLPTLMPAGPLSWLRHVVSLPTSGRIYVPEETIWDAAPRRRSLARWWNNLRGDVERWVEGEALKRDEARPFVLAGHGVGGGLAILAAYEFKKRARKVLGVVTFSATPIGGRKFADECQALGLDEVTLELQSRFGTLFSASLPLLYRRIGNVWKVPSEPRSPNDPLDGRVGPTGLGGYVVRLMAREEASWDDAPSSRVKKMLLHMLMFVEGPRQAAAAFERSRRFVVPLDREAKRRLNELAEAAKQDPAGSENEKQFAQHLRYIRGGIDVEKMEDTAVRQRDVDRNG